MSDSNTIATGCHGSDLMTRAQAAAMANVSVSTVRRWEGTVLPTVVGEDGVHRFRQEHVREIVERRVQSTPAAPDAYDGSTAAAVYALFDEGQNPADVVKRTGLQRVASRSGLRRGRESGLRGRLAPKGFYVKLPTSLSIFKWCCEEGPRW
jgi:hypothetical protein